MTFIHENVTGKKIIYDDDSNYKQTSSNLDWFVSAWWVRAVPGSDYSSLFILHV